MTFEPYEPVELVIKVEQNKREVENFCDRIKLGLKLRGGEYKREIILSDHFSEDGIYRLHNSCDCFVSTSFGEAWCVPAFDAMGFGKTPIVPKWGGYKEYMSDEQGWLVPVREEPCYGVVDSFDDLYTSNECWGNVSIPDLCLALRQAYENKFVKENKAVAGMDKVYGFGYETVGAKINDCLKSSGEKT